MRRSKYMSQSFLISLIIHGAILLVLSAYIAYTQSPPVKEWVSSVFIKAQKPDEPRKRQDQIKPAVKIVMPTEQLVAVESVSIAPRVVTTAAVMEAPAGYAPSEVLEFNNTPVVRNSSITTTTTNAPGVGIVRGVVTYANVPVANDGLAGGGGGSAPSAGMGGIPSIGRGIAGKQIRVAKEPIKPRGLPMIERLTTVAEPGIATVSKSVRLGFTEVTPLPKGDPGGSIAGRGKDIQGVFRLVRVQHDLSDWWADQSSLVALTGWLNSQTNIKTDMNVEGGSVRLTDPKLLKAPLLFFTGHDPSLTKDRSLVRGIALKNRLSEPERDGLRRYLLDKEGFIFFDDCGVNAPAQAFLRLMLAQIKYAMPEYTVDRIQNDHEIYNNFYDMGGPPVGFDIFWWGTHPPKRNFLEGITIGNHLCVVVCRRDYMCAMENVNLPSRAVHYSPGVYRFCTNVVVYALTHGKISDYSHYVPENNIADRISVEKPTAIPRLE